MKTIVALSLLLVASVAQAHPFHVSYAQVEFNRKSNSIEVALHTHAIDLERVLREVSGKKVDLDRTKDVDRLIQNYLKKVFLVRQAGKKKPLAIKWIGKETTIKSSWLYFEVLIPKGTKSIEMSQQLFFKTVQKQINTVNFRDGKKRKSIRFTADRPRHTLHLEQAKKPPVKAAKKVVRKAKK